MSTTNYPPGVTGSEPEIIGFAAWERWAETVKPGDMCRAGGAFAIVTAVTERYLWARVLSQTDSHPWEWEQVEPPA